jgi:hypothetical protein
MYGDSLVGVVEAGGCMACPPRRLARIAPDPRWFRHLATASVAMIDCGSSLRPALRPAADLSQRHSRAQVFLASRTSPCSMSRPEIGIRNRSLGKKQLAVSTLLRTRDSLFAAQKATGGGGGSSVGEGSYGMSLYTSTPTRRHTLSPPRLLVTCAGHQNTPFAKPTRQKSRRHATASWLASADR